jgi:hypothetical protein
VWIEERSLLLLQMRGMTPTSVLSKVLPGFLELPEDPGELLIKKQTEEVVLRLRSTYEREIRDRIRESTAQQQVQDLERARADQQAQELLKLGNLLQQTQRWDRAREALQCQDYEAPVWENVLDEINRMNGGKWTFDKLQSTAIEWWRRYGQATHA